VGDDLKGDVVHCLIVPYVLVGYVSRIY
jgi:hypothetical protein